MSAEEGLGSVAKSKQLQRPEPRRAVFVASLQDAGRLLWLVPGVPASLRSASTPGYFHVVPPGRGTAGLCGLLPG